MGDWQFPHAVQPAHQARFPVKNPVFLQFLRSLWGPVIEIFSASHLGELAACVLAALVVSAVPAQGQTVIATVPAGQGPRSVAVNPVTNKIYVPNYGSNNVTVIDGATNSTTTVTDPNANAPLAVVVNPVTNKIYVVNFGSNNVTVIDGATNSTTTVTDPNADGPSPMGPSPLAVNPVTNQIYVLNGGNITVIDGATNSTTTVSDPDAPQSVAVNPVTNKIYVPNAGNNTVMVIDGATNSTITVPLPGGNDPTDVAVNPVTNQIYVTNTVGENVIVIDGATNSATPIADPNVQFPYAAAVNPVTDKIYVTNVGSNNVTVIDGATNSTTTVTDPNARGLVAVAVNPVTNKIYVVNSGNVTVIDGATNSTTTVTDSEAKSPSAAAVNVSTDRIYVANAGSGNVTVINGAAPITLFPTVLNFGSQLLNTTSQPMTVTLTNTGGATLSISSIVASGNFSQTNNCGSSVLAGASCVIAVTYTPTRTSIHIETGTLTITDGAPGSPETVKLTGFGSVVTLSANSLNFGNQAVGTTSFPKTITFTNHSTSRAVAIAAITVSGLNSPAFAETNNCGRSLAAGASCTINITFRAFNKGSKTGTLNIWNNGSGTVQQVALLGNGT
jgi:YVTN family beta-propeller protein